MRRLFLIMSACVMTRVLGQDRTIIYCFPGQGSDHRIFDSLEVDKKYKLQVIEYCTPGKGENMASFAKKLSAEIDTTKPFVLMGVSLGGMICTEIAEILDPQKTIIISSAKSRNELPFRYKFQKAVPLYKLLPGKIILAGAKMLQPVVEPDRKKNKETFKSMLGKKDATYMKRTVELIVNWDKRTGSRNIFHIHGTNDHTLPLKKIRNVNSVIKKGSHMMTLTNAKKVSEAVNEILVR